MMKKWTLIALLFAAAALCAPNKPEDDVKAVLARQVDDWNRGDIPSFVDGYAADAVFVSTGVSRGSQQVLERYRKNYPNKEAMGTLTFSELEVQMLGADYASVIGRFHLARTAAGGGESKGIFSLLLRKRGGKWQIILDHTS